MRVTNNLMMNSLRMSLYKSTNSLVELTEKVATGKKINRPSDDPDGMGRVLDFQNTISRVNQYMQNIAVGKTHMEVTENVLEEVENYIELAQTVALDQTAGDSDSRLKAVDQIKSYFDQILSLANSKLGDRYLFAGNQSDDEPFSRNADGIDGTGDDYLAVYNGDDGEYKIIIGTANQVKINSHGDEVFTGDSLVDGVNIFNVLNDLVTALENPDIDAGTTQIISQLDSLEQAQDQVNAARIRSANAYDQLKTTNDYWTDFKVNIEQQLSNIQDADLAQSVVELQNQELVYETTLALAGEIMQISYLNFLR